MRNPFDRHTDQIVDRLLRPGWCHLAPANKSTKHRHDLEIKELRSEQGRSYQSGPRRDSVFSTIAKGGDNHAGVENDHR